jgi:predicted  nucleic acid-binding Zn-ribbon protein
MTNTSVTVPSSLRDEIEGLKRQKLELLEEKKRLRSRLARIEVESQRPLRATWNPRLITQLDREYHDLQYQIEAQRKELAALKLTDDAATVSELQEEAKIVYLERVRLEQYQVQQQQELSDIRQEYDDLMRAEGPEAIENQQRKIHSYQEKLERYKNANRKLSAKIKTARARRAFDSEEGREKIRVRAEELDQEIAKTREETAELQKLIDESKAEHRAEMRDLRTQSSQRSPRK